MFRTWLGHPSFDRYWQRMSASDAEFSAISIPVLTTTGYYADGGLGALYYFSEHHRNNPRANHTLVIGPYDDGVAQRGTPAAIRGYQIDAVALFEMRELRYQWLDAILRGGKLPALLKDRVNYQLMGANEWQHAPSLDAMRQGTLRFYLEENLTSDLNRLSEAKPDESAFLPQTFDLADRDDAAWLPARGIVSRGLKPRHGEIFVSEPVREATDIAGFLSGHLDLHVNRMDLDLHVTLYELQANGDYVLLHEPHEFRASYARERVRRRLLRAGVRQQLEFRSERVTSRRIQAGSRIVVELGITLRPDRQINYGTGDDVSEETLDDARIPLRIRWYNSSYVDVPVRR
jgi:predicted acyl esterase